MLWLTHTHPVLGQDRGRVSRAGIGRGDTSSGLEKPSGVVPFSLPMAFVAPSRSL